MRDIRELLDIYTCINFTFCLWYRDIDSDCIPVVLLCQLVGCFGLTALWDRISVFIGPSARQGERKEKRLMREKMSNLPPPAPTGPTIIQISRTLRHWKFTQHLRTTRPRPTLPVFRNVSCSWDCIRLRLSVVSGTYRLNYIRLYRRNTFAQLCLVGLSV